MKFGQILSIEAQDFLPPEAIEILSRLQNQAEPVETEILFELIKSEIGNNKFSQLNLQKKPLATASIGQVYSGQIDKKKVAVKVQYPNIAKSLDSDIRVIRNLLPLLLRLTGKSVDLNELLDEAQTVFKLETDYIREADNLIRYKNILQHDFRYIVPVPYPEYSSKRVLVMSFEEGIHLKEWIQSNPSAEQRLKIGTAILDLYILEFFSHGLVQTDPNLANFLVQPENNKLVLLDCGAVLKYSDEFLKKYKKLIKTLRDENEENVLLYCLEMGFLDPREEKNVQSLFVSMVKTSILPFQSHQQPFDFSDKDYSQQVREAVIEFTKNSRFTKPPRELIFLHRKLGGVFQILKMLEVKVDLSDFWQRALD